MKKCSIIITLLLISTMLFTACSNNQQATPAQNVGKLKIFTSFYPFYFLTSEIVGNKGEVINLTPAGAEPHDWEPKPRTVAALQEADMLVYNGLGMESWAESVINTMDRNKVKIVCASDGLEVLKDDEGDHDHDHAQSAGAGHAHDHGGIDPHVWVSPMKAKQEAQNILKALVEIDGRNKDYYIDNYNKLAEKLDRLDADFREAAKTFKSRIIVVSHKSFGYLAHEYGLEQEAIRGIVPDEEPSPEKMAELTRECREHGIKYIFFEKLVSPKLSETLAEEVGAQTLVLNAGHGLSAEEMKAGKNYITIMYENLENLKKALSK